MVPIIPLVTVQGYNIKHNVWPEVISGQGSLFNSVLTKPANIHTLFLAQQTVTTNQPGLVRSKHSQRNAVSLKQSCSPRVKQRVREGLIDIPLISFLRLWRQCRHRQRCPLQCRQCSFGRLIDAYHQLTVTGKRTYWPQCHGHSLTSISQPAIVSK